MSFLLTLMTPSWLSPQPIAKSRISRSQPKFFSNVWRCFKLSHLRLFLDDFNEKAFLERDYFKAGEEQNAHSKNNMSFSPEFDSTIELLPLSTGPGAEEKSQVNTTAWGCSDHLTAGSRLEEKKKIGKNEHLPDQCITNNQS